MRGAWTLASAFQEMLSEHDVAYMNSDPEDIQYELRHRRE
jgi:hypothetical protein